MHLYIFRYILIKLIWNINAYVLLVWTRWLNPGVSHVIKKDVDWFPILNSPQIWIYYEFIELKHIFSFVFFTSIQLMLLNTKYRYKIKPKVKILLIKCHFEWSKCHVDRHGMAKIHIKVLNDKISLRI